MRPFSQRIASARQLDPSRSNVIRIRVLILKNVQLGDWTISDFSQNDHFVYRMKRIQSFNSNDSAECDCPITTHTSMV